MIDVEQHCSERVNAFRQRLKGRLSSDLNPYELELVCFRSVPVGHPAKHEFCANLFRFQWPDFIALEKDGIQNTFALRVIKGCCENRFVDFLGCASSGKSTICSAYVYTLWKSSPWNTSAYISTTTLEALRTKTWAAILDLHGKDRFKIGNRLDYRHSIILEQPGEDKERDYRDAISCVVIEQGSEGRNALAAISGRKNENVIWVCDEMPYMDIGILRARLNLIANPFFQFIGIGNKPDEGDPLWQDAEPAGADFPDGWKSVTPDHDEWPTKSGRCIYLDGEKSPNFQVEEGAKPPFPSLMTRQMVDLIAKDSGGTDTVGYWHQVRGFPMQGDTMDRVLPWRIIERFGANEQPVWGPEEPFYIAGLDPGFKKDGDPCAVAFAKIGQSIEGQRVMCFEHETVNLRPKLNDAGTFEEQAAAVLLKELRARQCHDIAIDVSSDGGLHAQAIAAEAKQLNWPLNILLVSFMGTPDADATYEIGGKRQEAKQTFDRKVSELWYSFRLSVQNKAIYGLRSGTRHVRQFAERKVVMDEKRRWSVEPKKEMKKRLKRSPDDADACVLVHALAIKKGLSGAGKASVTRPAAAPVKSPAPQAPARYGSNTHAAGRYSRR